MKPVQNFENSPIQPVTSTPQTKATPAPEKLKEQSLVARIKSMFSRSAEKTNNHSPDRLASIPSGQPPIELKTTRRSLANNLGKFIYNNCIFSPGYYKNLAKEAKEGYNSIKTSFSKSTKTDQTAPKVSVTNLCEKHMGKVNECRNKYMLEKDPQISVRTLLDDQKELTQIKQWAEQEQKNYPDFSSSENKALRSLILNCEIEIETISIFKNNRI